MDCTIIGLISLKEGALIAQPNRCFVMERRELKQTQFIFVANDYWEKQFEHFDSISCSDNSSSAGDSIAIVAFTSA